MLRALVLVVAMAACGRRDRAASARASASIDGALISRDDVAPCVPAPTAAVAARYQEIRDLSLDELYAEQKPRLVQEAAARGDAVFVASFIRRSGRDGHDHSYAVISKGVPTLLPRVERISFFDPDRPSGQQELAIVRWDDAFALLGPRWTALPTSPARWRVDPGAFPTAAELARLPHVAP